MTNKPTTKKQTFAFTAPDAGSVLLLGDFTHWQEKPLPMKRDKHGVWKTSVSLPPGAHHYRFLVDGEWRDDPECTLPVRNPFGTENMVREVTPVSVFDQTQRL